MRIIKVTVTKKVLVINPINYSTPIEDAMLASIQAIDVIVPIASSSNIKRDKDNVILTEVRGYVNTIPFSSLYSIQDGHDTHVIDDNMTHREIFEIIENMIK